MRFLNLFSFKDYYKFLFDTFSQKRQMNKIIRRVDKADTPISVGGYKTFQVVTF